MTNSKKTTTRWLVESAILIAIGTVLSEIQIPWAFGGGITVCSTLPLVLLSFRFGWKRGFVSAIAFSLVQLLLGVHNVQYASSALMAAGIVLLDYIVPFSVIGLAGLFSKVSRKKWVCYVTGIVVTFSLRLLCHFITGVWIWDALWPNEFGWAAPIYSIAYNGGYMLPEMVLASLVAVLMYRTALSKYMDGEDLK